MDYIVFSIYLNETSKWMCHTQSGAVAAVDKHICSFFSFFIVMETISNDKDRARERETIRKYHLSTSVLELSHMTSITSKKSYCIYDNFVFFIPSKVFGENVFI